MAVAADSSKKAPPKRGRKLLVIALVGVVVAVAAAGAFWYLRGAPAAEPVSKLPAPAQYLPLSPPFVVNLDDNSAGPRYLQVEVQLVTRDPLDVVELQHHTPALRAKLLMRFAQQDAEVINTREGKEALRAQALEDVQALMTEETGAPRAESLLFTSFVTQ
ncbi:MULTISPECIES: flagellar basal body-associated FliL family protein [Luteimonas]|uniref:flagellar basal body-associated FliL family protein n=1 Tax=Luteimonas TaxID=83614 RepID=UPI000C7E7075|nr:MULTISPECIES: flagellar basal body-associated FliL family protein [Luteimonas]